MLLNSPLDVLLLSEHILHLIVPLPHQPVIMIGYVLSQTDVDGELLLLDQGKLYVVFAIQYLGHVPKPFLSLHFYIVEFTDAYSFSLLHPLDEVVGFAEDGVKGKLHMVLLDIFGPGDVEVADPHFDILLFHLYLLMPTFPI